MVVVVGVEGEVAEEFAGGGCDDADLEVVDEEGDGCSGVGLADSDVVELAGVSEGDGAGGVDFVVADPVVGSGGGSFWSGFGESGVGNGGGDASQAAVGAVVVVDVDETVELVLEIGEGFSWWVGVEELFEGLLESFDAPMFVKRRW